MNTEKESAFGFLRAMVFPDRCVFCDDAIEYRSIVCKDCRRAVEPIDGKCCNACGLPVKECDCKGKSTFYTAMTAVFRYEGVVRKGIHSWKYSDTFRNTEFYAMMIAEKVRNAFADVTFDYIAFVPQTREETDEKGFNQSEELACAVSEELCVPVGDFLVKLYETDRQHSLPLHDKRGNTFGVFDCINTDNIRDKKILLIDDVRTSGSTINECAKMLRLYESGDVYCAVIAAAVPKKGEK